MVYVSVHMWTIIHIAYHYSITHYMDTLWAFISKYITCYGICERTLAHANAHIQTVDVLWGCNSIHVLWGYFEK